MENRTVNVWKTMKVNNSERTTENAPGSLLWEKKQNLLEFFRRGVFLSLSVTQFRVRRQRIGTQNYTDKSLRYSKVTAFLLDSVFGSGVVTVNWNGSTRDSKHNRNVGNDCHWKGEQTVGRAELRRWRHYTDRLLTPEIEQLWRLMLYLPLLHHTHKKDLDNPNR